MCFATLPRPLRIGLWSDWFIENGPVIHRRVDHGRHRARGLMTVMIGAYQAVYFENVAQAVEYCHALVSHIVPRAGTRGAGDDRPVVWFHVPERSHGSTRDGCYLFASPGAIAAAERA